MKVRKSDGSLQEFELRKVKLVLERVSDECEESMTASDIKNMSRSIQRAAEKAYGDVIQHTDLRLIVRDTLKENGFSDVAEAYMRGRTACA